MEMRCGMFLGNRSHRKNLGLSLTMSRNPKIYFILILVIMVMTSCSNPRPGIIILCAGDSITAADYPRFLQRILKREGYRAKVLNFGRNGYTSGEYLAFLKENQDIMAQKHPEFILLQLGTNDVRIDGDHTSTHKFYQNMKKIIAVFRRFRSQTGRPPHIYLATIPPLHRINSFPFSPQSRIRIQEEINPTLRRLSQEENLHLVDNHTLFTRSPQFLPDVHPTRKGYMLLAQNWYNAIQKHL